jgi:hypothetical protein
VSLVVHNHWHNQRRLSSVRIAQILSNSKLYCLVYIDLLLYLSFLCSYLNCKWYGRSMWLATRHKNAPILFCVWNKWMGFDDLCKAYGFEVLPGHARLISSSISTTVKQVNYPSVSTSCKPGNPSSAVSCHQNKSKYPFSDLWMIMISCQLFYSKWLFVLEYGTRFLHFVN